MKTAPLGQRGRPEAHERQTGNNRKQTEGGADIFDLTFIQKSAWHQFKELFLDQLAELKGLYSLYYCRSLRMLVYAKGRRITTPPHMCTHENTITHKRSCFKPPKKKRRRKTASLKTLLIELALRNACVGVWMCFFTIPGSLGELGDYFITHP